MNWVWAWLRAGRGKPTCVGRGQGREGRGHCLGRDLGDGEGPVGGAIADARGVCLVRVEPWEGWGLWEGRGGIPLRKWLAGPGYPGGRGRWRAGPLGGAGRGLWAERGRGTVSGRDRWAGTRGGCGLWWVRGGAGGRGGVVPRAWPRRTGPSDGRGLRWAWPSARAGRGFHPPRAAVPGAAERECGAAALRGLRCSRCCR